MRAAVEPQRGPQGLASKVAERTGAATIASTGARPAPVLAVRDLRIGFPGGVRALRGVTLDVLPGEILGLVGESGSGKSVLGLAALGLLPTSAQVSGSVLLGGQEMIGAGDEQRRLARRPRHVVGREPRPPHPHVPPALGGHLPRRDVLRLLRGQDLLPAPPRRQLGTAYMLAKVADMQTPDPSTFVVKLKEPVAPFMDYMASSWGPKIISPKALTANAGTDHAQTWAKTAADGTGPFKLTAFNRGQNYELTRNDAYWGSKANFAKLNIRIIPEMNNQILQLRSGGLDVILHSYPVAELPTAKADPNLAVRDFSSCLQSLLYINANKAPFSDLAARKAVAADVDRDTIVNQIYGSYGHPAGSPYAPGILDQSLAPIAYPTSTVKGPSTPITFAYSADESGIQGRLAQLIQQKLTAQGFQVSIKEVQLPQVYGYANDLAHAPDLLLMTNTPDAAHPDTWARILWGSTGGAQLPRLLEQAGRHPARPGGPRPSTRPAPTSPTARPASSSSPTTGPSSSPTRAT